MILKRIYSPFYRRFFHHGSIAFFLFCYRFLAWNIMSRGHIICLKNFCKAVCLGIVWSWQVEPLSFSVTLQQWLLLKKINWSHNNLTFECFKHGCIPSVFPVSTNLLDHQPTKSWMQAVILLCLFFSAYLIAWKHWSLFNLAGHTCSLSAAVMTSLSAGNPNHPLPATWELPSIIRAFTACHWAAVGIRSHV